MDMKKGVIDNQRQFLKWFIWKIQQDNLTDTDYKDIQDCFNGLVHHSEWLRTTCTETKEERDRRMDDLSKTY